MTLRRSLFAALALASLAACTTTTPPKPEVATKPLPKLRIGVALGGGAAKGFAHVGVLKMLEAQGLTPVVVSGTSAGSVVGSLYAAGYTPFELQEKSFALDEDSIRDLSLGGGGLVKGEKLQDYVNKLVSNRPIEKLSKPFAAVATNLDTGKRTAFVRGNTGQAVRASSSIPSIFQPVQIGNQRYVDGGVVSPVPVDAARDLGADFVIAVDISTKPEQGKGADGMVSILNQTITIMGRQLGEQELARADFVIRPRVGRIGPADFDQKHIAILEGEKATQAALPAIKQKIEQKMRELAAKNP
ncbi:patatin-like phospholipase family protein [Parachitinimonas caeni]|uniref:Patatin-like phospholipase family protein n=1 Tax=Parachitinimonas caeni TaxID=3031301 RepID=A0ABT7DQU9_9NEIS|nr:patatin-like phospholipase family protein [Parachitinimonas caeni]MDK2122450.1 patatin-like phospholipase family protein [Parachitinimonas caeni]